MLRLIAPVTNDIDVQDSQKLQLSCVSTLGLVPKDLSILGPLAVTQCTARPMTVRVTIIPIKRMREFSRSVK
eukprot:3119914-Pyramimonas_sp.AAC.1